MEWAIYEAKLHAYDLDSFSYSFETRKFYFAKNPAHRKELMMLYGDGHSPLNIIAVYDVYGVPLHYFDVSNTIKRVIADGHIPFIGKWTSSGTVCRGVSIILDHGVADREIAHLLADCGQDYAARITMDKLAYFPTLS